MAASRCQLWQLRISINVKWMSDRRADTKAFADLKKKGLRGDGPATLKMKRLLEPLLPRTRRERCDLPRRRFRPLSKKLV